jgi:2-polyprenyl-3-methyl-5-hydroxy-6-metoxy-1,4-benzoquinol methylase
MESYTFLSEIYDAWQNCNRPSKWADYTEKILRKHLHLTVGDGEGHRFLLADLGCGTGDFAIEMNRRGYEVIAVDRCADMLTVATGKQGANEVRFICQDITALDLYGTVDVMVCYLDTVNHLLTVKQLERFFSRCKIFLNPDAVMIFDILMPIYFESLLAQETYYEIRDEYVLIWENRYNNRKQINTALLTAFVSREDQSYHRFEEAISERCYPPEQIRRAIEASGLSITAQYGEFTLRKPKEQAKRVFYVVKNKGR